MVAITVEQVRYFAAPPEAIWPAIANSALAGETSDPGRYETVDELQADGSVLRRAWGNKFGIAMKRWNEDLGEWVVPNYCRQFRKGEEGMADYADFEVVIAAEGAGTRVHVRAEMSIPGPLGWIADKAGIMRRATLPIVENYFLLIERQLAQASGGAGDDPLAHLTFEVPPLSENAQRQLQDKCQGLTAAGHDPALVALLADYLARAPETFLHRIRPLVLAAEWAQPAEAVVDLCLGGHGAGLLALQWNVLCPRCRNSRDPQADLQDLPQSLHCSTCNVDYERDFSHNVELTFSPEPWLRDMPVGQACLMGQASVPHILVQRRVAAGSELLVFSTLGAGGYRARTAQAGDAVELDFAGGGFPEIIAEDGGIRLGASHDGGGVLLKNREHRDLTFVLEELSWRRDALTGDQVIANAAFRRHCPGQLLRPGDDVAIANVVLMFTDIKSSTSLYEAIGDAAAYNLVRDHFDYLGEFVARHNGTLVKTMGDAIMAVFSSGEEAFAAALEAQDGIANFNRDRQDGGIVLKIGLHQGACIAVASNGIMDYFGSTVNLASRLQSESRGGDIVISEALNDLLAAPPEDLGLENYHIAHETGHLRGIEAPVDYCRLTMRELL